MVLYQLFIEFFKIGLFAVGGGQATIPFLYDLCNRYTWFTGSDLANMIAISESTPGPIGINMATYVGYNVAGFVGGIVATLSLVLPSLIVIILISKVLEKFKGNPYVDNIFSILRPCVVGLIASAGFTVFSLAVLNMATFSQTGNVMDLVLIKPCLLFICLFVLVRYWKKHPIVYLGIAMVVGVILQF